MSRLETGLEGRRCLVTGAGNGIGRAVAGILAAEGARLVLTDIDGDSLEAVELPDVHPSRVVADVSERGDVEKLIGEAESAMGGLDALIHCAGIYRTTPLPEVTDDEWSSVIDINLRSSFLLCQGGVEAMRESGGSIVLFGSFAARTGGLRASAPYAASKAGVEGLTRNVAAYAGPLGVRVNCIHPGFTDTAMTWCLSDDARDEAMKNTPLRRGASPEDQAQMAVVLVSDLSNFVHGVALDVNGGMYMA